MDDNIEDLVKTTTRGSLILLVGQVSSTFILAFGMLLVAKFLGSSNYGSFNIAQSVVQIAILLSGMGINSAMTKFLAQYRHEGKQGYLKVFIESGLILTFAISILATVIVYLLSGVIANNVYNVPDQEIFIKYLSISILGQAFSTLAQGVTVGFERMELRSLINIVYSLIKSVVSPVLVYIGLGVLGAVLGHTSPILLSGALGTFFILIIYKKERHAERPITHFQAMKLILEYGFPLYLSSIVAGILPQIYTALLGIWETTDKIGNYSVAINFGVLLSFVTLPISTAIFPLFSKLTPEHSELEFLFRNSIKYSVLFGYPIIVTVIALADQIISVLGLSEYVFASNYLRIYMLNFLCIGLGSGSNGPLLFSQNKTNVVFRITLITSLISLPIVFFSIKNYGVVGLLYASLFTTIIGAIITVTSVYRLFKFKLNLPYIMKMLGISLITYLLLYYPVSFIELHPLIELLLGGLLTVLIFLSGILVLKVLTKQDYLYLQRLSDSFGPLSPMFHWLVNMLIKFS